MQSMRLEERGHSPVWMDKSWDSAQHDWIKGTLVMLCSLKVNSVGFTRALEITNKEKLKREWRENWEVLREGTGPISRGVRRSKCDVTSISLSLSVYCTILSHTSTQEDVVPHSKPPSADSSWASSYGKGRHLEKACWTLQMRTRGSS